MIAGKKQAVGPLVENAEGKHAPQAAGHPLAALLIQVDKNLRIASGTKLVTFPAQLPAKFNVIIDFAVGDHTDRMVFVPDRLPAAVEIDDREPAHTERHVALAIEMPAFSIRPTMDERLQHPREVGAGIRRPPINEPGYPAHCRCSSADRYPSMVRSAIRSQPQASRHGAAAAKSGGVESAASSCRRKSVFKSVNLRT